MGFWVVKGICRYKQVVSVEEEFDGLTKKSVMKKIVSIRLTFRKQMC